MIARIGPATTSATPTNMRISIRVETGEIRAQRPGGHNSNWGWETRPILKPLFRRNGQKCRVLIPPRFRFGSPNLYARAGFSTGGTAKPGQSIFREARGY